MKKIIHLMYFPWDHDQNLNKDQNNFDKTHYNKLKKKLKDWNVWMWTYDKTKQFCDKHYPGVWELVWKQITRPVQAVDFFRLLVVYHFGGLYWQYGSVNFVPFEQFLVSSGKKSKKRIRFFVETVISKEYAKKMSKQPIRNGKPEERIRISFGVFSAYPKHEFLKFCIVKSFANLKNLKVKCDYDVLYIGGNAMFTEAYHQYGDKSDFELISYKKRKRMIRFNSKGSWKTDSTIG